MNQHIHVTKIYITTHTRELIVGGAIILGFAVLIALFIYNNPRTVVYQPVNACELFTPAEAQDLLGNKVINVNTKNTVVSGNIATSKCSYTDSNPTQDQMIVAAIAVRSGVNDEGVAQNKTEFATGKPSVDVEIVKDLGDSAYFNHTLGQLNVLSGRQWIIVSYGVGSTPEANTVDKAVELAHKLI